MLPPVLAMRPFFVEKLWGGARLAGLPAKKRPGHTPPAGMRVGESWEVADVPEGTTVVDSGPLAGTSLRALVEQHGRALVGGRATAGPDGILRFPLLVKLIDAGDDLSVQVHPDTAWARTHPGTFAKDEAWLVVDAAPGAKVLHGVRDHVDAATFRKAIDEGRAHELLREVRVSPGDILRIEPGTFHAVGRGCLLLEVQEPSDTTYRVWDYNRTDGAGKRRALHIEEAMAVARFGAQDVPLVGDAVPGIDALRTPLYALRLDQLGPGSREALRRPAGEPAVIFVLAGEVSAQGASPQGSEAVPLPAGAAAVVPASAGPVFLTARADAMVVVMTTGS